ncbi:hypothetical protein QBC40DRAFT_249911 [Triangularia verruculosa]|uniref:Uncharacterized protein n=1 Tax=Triangularia verruculosa TaxID=2587418 RepID=A0AAN6XQ54_9PEZI|nr:hypothetical protein QBC40DRAFT_249911 [Triangularia verruculosa]
MADFTNSQGEKSQPMSYRTITLSQPFNEQLNHQLEKMNRTANQLALIADMMNFQPGQHTEAWNENVANFMKEAEGCVGLVRSHKEQAHANMVVALMMVLALLGGFLLLGGYFFIKDIVN